MLNYALSVCTYFILYLSLYTQTLAKSTQPTSTKKDTCPHLNKSLSIPLRTKKDDLALIRDILQDNQPSAASKPKSPTKSVLAKSLPANYVDVLRANTPKPNKPRTKVFTPYGGFQQEKLPPEPPPTPKPYNRFQPEKLPSEAPPVVRPKTALSTSKSRVQSAASSSLSDRIKSAPARRVRTRTAPPSPEKRALIPKTLTTRKGALLLFTAPGDFDFSMPQEQGMFMPIGPPDVPELGTKLGTTKKLAASVLQYGNENVSKQSKQTFG